MRMELLVHPDDAGTLTRLPGLVRVDETRPRARQVRLVWHDSLDHALFRDGLALSEERGHWRVECLDQRTQAWSPATPAPVLEEAADLSGLTSVLPEALGPAAAFHGRTTTHALIAEGETVTLTLLRGAIRTVVSEQPASRVILDGPETALLSVASHLARSARVTAPMNSLAAEARGPGANGGATAAAPVTLRETDATPGTAFRHVLGGLLRAMLVRAPQILAGSGGTEPVHQMRVAVRRARSTITVFRPAIACPVLHQAVRHLKTLGGQLGPTRDWDVFVTETLPAVMAAMPDHPALIALHKAAERRRRDCRTALETYLAGADFRVLSVELAWLAGAETWVPPIGTPPAAGAPADLPPTGDLSAFAVRVLQRRAHKLTASGRKIKTLAVPALHTLRLRAKRTRYAAEILGPLFPGRHAPRYLRRLSRLQQSLGVLNDGAVAASLLDQLGGARGRHAYAAGLVTGFIAHRAASIRPEIEDAFEKFRRTEPFWA